MRRRLGRMLPFIAATALLGCAQGHPSSEVASVSAQPANPSPIAAAAVQALYAVPHREDGTVMQGSHQGAHWIRWAKPDGSLELLAAHGLFADSGKYVIRGNALCMTWGHIDEGKESCVHLVQVSADEYVTYGTDGSQGSRFRVGPP
jgi:hypothetical protein